MEKSIFVNDVTKELTPNFSAYDMEERYEGIYALSIKVINVLFMSNGLGYSNFFDKGVNIDQYLYDISDDIRRTDLESIINAKLQENFPDFSFDVKLGLVYLNNAKTEHELTIGLNLEPLNSTYSTIFYDTDNIKVEYLIQQIESRVTSIEIKF
jgi:hypothetical protein